MINSTLIAGSLILASQAQPAPETAETQAAVQEAEAVAQEPGEGEGAPAEAAQEGSGPPAEPARTPEEIADDDKIVCKREAVVGSRFKKRICATKKEWRTLRERSSQETANMQRRMRGFEPSS